MSRSDSGLKMCRRPSALGVGRIREFQNMKWFRLYCAFHIFVFGCILEFHLLNSSVWGEFGAGLRRVGMYAVPNFGT